jgi:hypothetical protein
MSDVYKLTLDQVEKAGIKTDDNKVYFLSIPPAYNGSIKPFIYSTSAQVKVEKELTIQEAFAL